MQIEQPFRFEAGRDAATPSLLDRLRWLADWMSARMITRANHMGTAVLCKELSRLPDVELQGRGLSRGTLARDIVRACDRGWVLPNPEKPRERPG